jgi:GT2 family glycosyltransferase
MELPSKENNVMVDVENNIGIPKNGASGSLPIKIQEIEISLPLPVLSNANEKYGYLFEQIIALIKLHSQPLGTISIPLNGQELFPEEYAPALWTSLGPKIKKHLEQDGLPVPTSLDSNGLRTETHPVCIRARERLLANAPFVTIIVASHNRVDSLERCLDSLLSLKYPNFEVIVVDSAPEDNANADLIRKSYSGTRGSHISVRYIREDYPGLAVARNRGLEEVKSPIVAFTDDDVIVDRFWLAEMVLGLSMANNAGCVTGMILPAELATPAQLWFEDHGGFNKGCEKRVYDLHQNITNNPLYPYNAGQFGSGASMAFRTAVLRDIGGFDPALGTGTHSLGGDDLATFYQLITSGYQLVYNPSAILHHWHHRDYEDLRRQTYGYGAGLTAFVTKTLLDRPQRLLEIAAKIPFGLHYLLNPRSPKNRYKSAIYPQELASIEKLAMLSGPFAYLRSQWHWHRHIRKTRQRKSALPSRAKIQPPDGIAPS